MKKILTLMLIATITISILLTSPGGLAQTGTSKGGVVSADENWNLAGSPYTLNANLLVAPGVTLTIQSGVTVNFGNYFLWVNGTMILQPGTTLNMGILGEGMRVNGILKSEGTVINPIHINGAALGHNFPQPFYSYSSVTFSPGSSSGTTIEYTEFTQSYLEISSSMKFQYNNMPNGSIIVHGGSPNILGNIIHDGLSVAGGSPTITNNTLGAVSFYNLDNPGNAVFQNNHIQGGLTLYAEWQHLLVQGNTISGASMGIQILTSQSAEYFDARMYQNSQTIIQYNTITGNQIGIYAPISYAPTIINNNIYGNQVNFKLGTFGGVPASGNISVINNYWGTTDEATIRQSIYDYNNDFTLGHVNFVPFLTSPVSGAPPVTPSNSTSTITPSPKAEPSAAQPTPTLLPPWNGTTTPHEPKDDSNVPTFDILEVAILIVLVVLAILVGVLIVTLRRRQLTEDCIKFAQKRGRGV